MQYRVALHHKKGVATDYDCLSVLLWLLGLFVRCDCDVRMGDVLTPRCQSVFDSFDNYTHKENERIIMIVAVIAIIATITVSFYLIYLSR